VTRRRKGEEVAKAETVKEKKEWRTRKLERRQRKGGTKWKEKSGKEREGRDSEVKFPQFLTW